MEEQVIELLAKMNGAFDSIPPEMWKYTLAQAGIAAKVAVAWMWGTGVLAVVSLIASLICYTEHDDSVAGTLLLMLFAGLVIGFFANVGPYLTASGNPEFWAMQKIISSVPTP